MRERLPGTAFRAFVERIDMQLGVAGLFLLDQFSCNERYGKDAKTDGWTSKGKSCEREQETAGK